MKPDPVLLIVIVALLAYVARLLWIGHDSR